MRGDSARRPRLKAGAVGRRPSARPKISLSGTAPGGPTVPGGIYGWRYALSNRGGKAARNVVVTLVLPKGLRVVTTSRRCAWQGGRTVRCGYGSLLPGRRVRGGFTAKVRRGAAAGVPMRPRAAVRWNRPATRHAVALFPGVAVARTANISMTGSAPRRVRPNQRVIYRLRVTNNGAARARGVTLTIGGDRRIRALSAGTGVGCRTAGARTVCTLGDLMRGDTRVVTFIARMPRGPKARVAARAVVRSATVDPRRADNAVRLVSTVAGTALPVRTKGTGTAKGVAKGTAKGVAKGVAKGAGPRAVKGRTAARPVAVSQKAGVAKPGTAVRPASVTKPALSVKRKARTVSKQATRQGTTRQQAYGRQNFYPHGAQGWRPPSAADTGGVRHREAADPRTGGGPAVETPAAERSLGMPADTRRMAAHTRVGDGRPEAAPSAAVAAPHDPAMRRPQAPVEGKPQAPGTIRAGDAAAFSVPGWGTATAVVAMGALLGGGVAFAFMSGRSRRYRRERAVGLQRR